MKEVEMKITVHGNNQLYIPLSRKLDHAFKAGETVIITVHDDTIVVKKK